MDLERLTARVLDTPNRGSGARLDAYRIDNDYYVDIELPGADPADIDVEVDRQALTVRCARRGRRRHVAERQVPLAGHLDTDRLAAHYADGVLTLNIPVVEAAA